MTVSDYSSNPTVIILVGIGILLAIIEMRVLFFSNIWDWNPNEMHVLFIDIWMTVSDYNTNPTVIILVAIGILPNCIF